MTENVWQLEEGEVRKPGIVHVVMLALFTGIGIVVGTFGSLAIPIGFVSAFWPGRVCTEKCVNGSNWAPVFKANGKLVED